MRRRTWLVGSGSALVGSLSGCLGPLEDAGRDDGEDDSSDANGPGNGSESEYVREPDGEADLTVALELASGFGEPDEYELTLDLSRVALTRAGQDGGVAYPVGEVLEVRKTAGSDDYSRPTYELTGRDGRGSESDRESEYTLVSQEPIPVDTYDDLRFYGSVTANTISGDDEVTLSGADRIERSVGAVFEEGDHTEYTVHVGLNEADQGYELTDNGETVVDW